jgi:peptide chain release factor 1
LIFEVKGKKAQKCYEYEGGIHQFQRVPPTEKRGRVQTSLITVAVVPKAEYARVSIEENDLLWRYTRGYGAGGQHKNKTDSCVILTHIATGVQVRIDGRKQSQNKKEALRVLTDKLENINKQENKEKDRADRRSQIGEGGRGCNKIRTVRAKDGIVIDHRLDKTMLLKDYLRGRLLKFRN